MEEGAHVWLRSDTSAWGWIPALLSRKWHTLDVKSQTEMTHLTFVQDQDVTGKDAAAADADADHHHARDWEVTLVLESQVLLQSVELDDVKMRNLVELDVHTDTNDVNHNSHNGGGGSSSSSYSSGTRRKVVAGGVDDLIELMHLHEPAILHSLRLRYEQDVIYTATGPILIAINPFKAMPDLYSKEVCMYVVGYDCLLVLLFIHPYAIPFYYFYSCHCE